MQRFAARICLILFMVLLAQPAGADGVQSRFADVNETRLHYLIAGKGDTVILLHGFGESSRMWLPLMMQLAKNHTVIAPDLRGSGQSAAPEGGYTKALLAQDVHALMLDLGVTHAQIVGHDIGMMVAYAYAAQYAAETDRLVLMDAFLPGIGDWKNTWLSPDLWHLHFFGPAPLALVQGRERIYLDHLWNDFAADPRHSVPLADRDFYAHEYAQPDHMRAGFEYFHTFDQDAEDFAYMQRTALLDMPVLVLTGEKAAGQSLITQAKLVAVDVDGVVIPATGHWLMEEAPSQTIARLLDFLNRPLEP